MKTEEPFVTAYWWTVRKNFGDILTEDLIRHFVRAIPVHAPPMLADLLVTGSNLDVIPSVGWDGIVAGAGQLHPYTHTDLRGAIVLGLRGTLTRDASIIRPGTDLVLGDPGLLASELVPVRRGLYPLGCVPHITDKELFPRELANAARYGYATPRLIDPTGDPLEVIRQIGACEKIIASSLHAVIVADSFSIPRRVEPFSAMSTSPHEGGAFKFDDYSSVIGQPLKWGELQRAPRPVVDARKSELFDMFQLVRGMIRAV